MDGRNEGLMEVGTVPLWRKISDELRDRILSGQYTSEFPGELDIAAEFSVSRGTARAALRPLRESGLISSGRGRRPQIAQVEPGSQYGAIYSLHELITTAGMRHRSRVLQQLVTTDAVAADHLSVPADEPLFLLERVRFADEQPVAVDEIFSPASVAGSLVDIDFTDTPFYRELRERCGVTIEGGREQIQAQLAGDRMADLLVCPPETPLLLLERVAFSGGQTVEFRRSRFLGDRFRMVRRFGASAENGPTNPDLL